MPNNDFTATNLSTWDVVLDNPSPNSNYCTLNALDIGGGTLSEGNLAFVAGGAHRAVKATQAFPPSSKRYFEVVLSNSFSNPPAIGIMSDTAKVSDQINAIQSRFVRGNGYTYNNGSEIASGYASWASGDIIGLQIDTTANTLKFRINGGSWTTAFSDLSGYAWLPCLKSYDGAHKLIANFGQDPTFAGNKSGGATSEFFYTPPTGFSALSTGNLATPAIAKSSEHFSALTYASSGAKTGVGFQPDLVWVKARGNAYDHELTDSVRGVTKALSSNDSGVETTDSTGLTAFGSDGFTVGAGTNYSTSSMVAWSWKESATAGMDIVTWTGDDDGTGASPTPQAVSHSLGVAPDLIIAKSRTQNTFHNFDWIVWHKDLTSGNYLLLNGTGAETGWGDALVSSIGSSSVTFGSDAMMSGEDLNAGSAWASADDYVAYLFASVAGYSKAGSYSGNSSAAGPFVYCGFRPAFILIKSTGNPSSNGYWMMKDEVRSTTYNPADGNLYANEAFAEDTTSTVDIDFLSNGFKIKGTYAGINATGSSYIFYAVAEAPLKYANAR
jgi:hypothetical protein